MAAKRSAGQPPAKRSRHQARSYHSLDRLLVYKLDRPVEMIQRARGARLRASGAGWIATDICRYRSSADRRHHGLAWVIRRFGRQASRVDYFRMGDNTLTGQEDEAYGVRGGVTSSNPYSQSQFPQPFRFLREFVHAGTPLDCVDDGATQPTPRLLMRRPRHTVFWGCKPCGRVYRNGARRYRSSLASSRRNYRFGAVGQQAYG